MEHDHVYRITSYIAEQLLKKTLIPNKQPGHICLQAVSRRFTYGTYGLKSKVSLAKLIKHILATRPFVHTETV